MLEKELEKKFREAVERHGGRAFKLTSPGCAGLPDRMVIFPGGRIGFVELKAPGEKPRKLQQHRVQQLRALGCAACVLDSKDKIYAVIMYIMSGACTDPAWHKFLTDREKEAGL